MQTSASQTEGHALQHQLWSFTLWLKLSLPVQELENEVFKLCRSETQVFFNLRGKKQQKGRGLEEECGKAISILVFSLLVVQWRICTGLYFSFVQWVKPFCRNYLFMKFSGVHENWVEGLNNNPIYKMGALKKNWKPMQYLMGIILYNSEAYLYG